MTYQVVDSTDKKYVGNMVEYNPGESYAVINGGIHIDITKTIKMEDGWRLANSNYCIDIKGE